MTKLRFSSSKFLAVVFLFALSPSAVSAQDQADIVAEAEKSLLKIAIGDAGQGSGYVVDSTGIAVTNFHVIAGAETGKTVASFPNGVQCAVTGTYFFDEGRDIAIIQLDQAAQGSMAPIKMAANLPRKGEEVLALGSPLGLSFTATRGIVSAIRTEDEMKTDLDDDTIRGTWVQVDAALSPGNSGGPLINQKGELIGMSTRASFGMAQNLNFGISIMDIKMAIENAKGKSLVALNDGVGKMMVKNPGPKARKKVKITRSEIPASAIRSYLDQIEKDYNLLAKAVRREITIQKDRAKSIKFGDSFFLSMSERNEMLKRAEVHIRDLEEFMTRVGRSPTKEGVLAFATKYGSTVDLRKKGSVGYLAQASAVRDVDENVVMIRVDHQLMLLWVEDTTGLTTFSARDEFHPGPVYVAGTEKLIDEDGPAVTLLISVSEEELKSVLDSESSASSDVAVAKGKKEVRTWKDKSGKFQIEASLLEYDGKEVLLKKVDGKTVRIPLTKLSSRDQNFLREE